VLLRARRRLRRRQRRAGARARAGAAPRGAVVGGGSGRAAAAPAESDAGGGGGGTGGLSAATLREIAAAVAMLASRKAKERAAGARELALVARRDVGKVSNRKRVELEEAVMAAGGRHPADRARAWGKPTQLCACGRGMVCLFWQRTSRSIAVAAGGIPPLIALLSSSSAVVQGNDAGALNNLSLHVESRVPIASAGVAYRLSSRFLHHTRLAYGSVLWRPHCAT
jgi:hypothetical protein